jgi:hypothetical protein
MVRRPKPEAGLSTTCGLNEVDTVQSRLEYINHM